VLQQKMASKAQGVLSSSLSSSFLPSPDLSGAVESCAVAAMLLAYACVTASAVQTSDQLSKLHLGVAYLPAAVCWATILRCKEYVMQQSQPSPKRRF